MGNHRDLRAIVKKLKDDNKKAPFAIHDTGYINYLEDNIKDMSNKDEYNEIPVSSCKYCKSLFILEDELDNEVCGGCGSMNSTVIMSINEYLEQDDEED